LHKIKRSPYLETEYITGIKSSTGIDYARKFSVETSVMGLLTVGFLMVAHLTEVDRLVEEALKMESYEMSKIKK
jgi:uncharacterized membrane protein